MKQFTFKQPTTAAYGEVLERIEILRSALRWAQKLDRAEIQKLLRQCNGLRDDVMMLSRKERVLGVSAEAGTEPDEVDHSKAPPGVMQRRQGLIDRSFVFEGVFGENAGLLEALEVAERAAPTSLPVLIEGESGTGKELMAKVIHSNGSRADGPYVSVNCGAIPENLIESELFGHRKGAFTGAASDRRGRFESANGGTIFLDEIGELPLQGQVKLLRVLQSQEIQRVGSDEPIAVDTRIVAATNRNLFEMSRKGSFREDLYYRLSVIHVTLPALRERRDEIPLLIDYFCGEAAEQLQRDPVKLSARLRHMLLNYGYPGNIRELRNIVYRLTCLADEVADLKHLPDHLRPEAGVQKVSPDADPMTTLSLSDVRKIASDEAERQFLEQGLREVAGRVTALARNTGMNRSYLQTLLKKHRINSKDFRRNPSAPI
ncbi:MAG: sigma-54-dependent Fis family transcriptional regulator [Ectothiorhodospiraceae bacterium]|nr:sigma-54-dependent Fis family transcriptional regulator [Ectothiorhodospiraceae bacterium]